MGGCLSRSPAQDAANQHIEQVMRERKKELNKISKCLMLGTGDSGKSTVLKQMRLMHAVNFTPQELENFRQLVFLNLVEGMKSVRTAIEDLNFQVSDETMDLLYSLDSAPDVKDGEPYPTIYLATLQTLWGDADLQKAISQSQSPIPIPDNLTYFFNHLSRLTAPDYKPTEQDIVHTRSKTTGIHEVQFRFGKRLLNITDVGGQRSERRKWIHQFQDVTALLFLVALSGYDQCLVEERHSNQMQDAMQVWASICNSNWFMNTSIILFLNKEDIFRDKLRHSPIRNFFPDYDGEPEDAEAGMRYFKKRFLRLHGKAEQNLTKKQSTSKEQKPLGTRQIYCHYTTATDTQLIRHVIASVTDIIFREHMEQSNML